MNDLMIYALTTKRYADFNDQGRRSRTIRSRNYGAGWTRVTASARERFALLAHALTNGTRTPTAD
jgi:outer membrane receptor for ferric coprogen and ferric-rhodotorulic acid